MFFVIMETGHPRLVLMTSAVDLMTMRMWEVGAVGFEPTTSWSQTMRAKPLRHAPSVRIIAGK